MAGFRTFATGEVLTAANVNDFLMKQSVMVFADAAARTAALGAEVAEGMLTYNEDTEQLEVFDGSAFVPAGAEPPAGIGSNVVSVTKTDTFSTTSNTFTDITGLSVTMTPSTDTSKVLLVASVPMGNEALVAGDNSYLQFSGGNTSVYVGDADGNRVRAAASFFTTEAGANNQPRILGNNLLFLDSPASGSPVTYTVQVRVSTGTAFINRNGFDTDSASYGRTAATLVAIEVAA